MPLSKTQLAAYRNSSDERHPIYTDLLQTAVIPGPGLCDYIQAESISKNIASTNQKLLINEYKYLRANNEGLKNIAPIWGTMIPVYPDFNANVCSLVFGVLISASIALLNQTSDEAAMRKTLRLMLNDAIELWSLYQRGLPALEVQSKYFPIAGNKIIHLIKSILLNKILTSELVHQASKDIFISKSTLNPALTDLGYYMLYKQGLICAASPAPEENNTTDHINYIRIQAYKRCNLLKDLLRTQTTCSSLDRDLICKHLNIHIQTILIPPDARIHVLHEGVLSKTITCTLVNAKNHSNIFFDLKIQKQIEDEIQFQSAFVDLETQLTKSTLDHVSEISRMDSPQTKFSETTRKHVQWMDESSIQHETSLNSFVETLPSSHRLISHASKFFSVFFCSRNDRSNPIPQTPPSQTRSYRA